MSITEITQGGELTQRLKGAQPLVVLEFDSLSQVHAMGGALEVLLDGRHYRGEGGAIEGLHELESMLQTAQGRTS